MVDIEIKYNGGKGHVVLYLDKFMRCKSVQKLKKILKLNALSDDWNEAEKNVQTIKEYVQQYLENVESNMKEYANKYADYRDKLIPAQEKVDKLVVLRDKFKRSSEQYKELSEKVKAAREEVRHIKAEDFVFDKYNSDNWDKCAKIYRTYSTLDELYSDKSNNFLSNEKLEILKGVVANKKHKN